MINNNSYFPPEKQTPRVSMGFENDRSAYRQEDRALSSQTVLMGQEQQLLNPRGQNSAMSFMPSPRSHNYQMNFSMNRNNNNLNTMSQVTNSTQQYLVNSNVSNSKQFSENKHLNLNSELLDLKLTSIEDKLGIITATLAKHDKKLTQLEQKSPQIFTKVYQQIKSLNQSFDDDSYRIQSLQKQIEAIKSQVQNMQTKNQNAMHNKIEQFENYVLKSFILNQKDVLSKVIHSEEIKQITQASLKHLEEKLCKVSLILNSHRQFSQDFGLSLEQRVKSLQAKLNQQLVGHLSDEKISRSVLKSSHTPIVLRYVQNFRVSNAQRGAESYIGIAETTYKIDQDGYLLDDDLHYLIDSKGNKLKLQQKHILLLKKQNILK